MKTFVAIGAISSLVLACGSEPQTESDSASVSPALGVTGPAFYAEGAVYRTVGTPTEFSASQPAHSTDTIYDLGGLQLNVADSAPGVVGYDGGRWEVHAVMFDDYASALAEHDVNDSGNFDFVAELEAAIEAGDATDLGVVKRFECPVIKLPKR